MFSLLKMCTIFFLGIGGSLHGRFISDRQSYDEEVQVSNMYGDYSESLKFDIRVEGDSQKVPELNLVLDGSYIEVNWSAENQGDKVILQWTNNLKTNWNNITTDQYEIQNDKFIYKERPRQEKRFYRLIKP